MRLLVVLAAAAALLAAAAAHEHHGEAPTCSGGTGRVLAEFRPGEVTVDGHSDDWDGVEASEFALLPALDPDEDKAYSGGKVAVKAVHDGVNVFFMLQVDGAYAYSKGESSKCPSVALMFQVGDKATYYNMGGCKDMRGSCTNKSCRGHEVDIMHFEIGSAIPGRLYGGNHIDNGAGNGGDRFGHLVDVYAWNPHCRYLDGVGPKENNSNAQNDWHGAWWHSSLTVHSGFVDDDNPYGKQDEKGTYYFEFSRPLRTMDRFQQDAQFTIGQPSNMAVAFWYPTDGKEWSDSEHYSASCNWLILDIQPSSEAAYYHPAPNRSWDAATAFALLLSVVTAALAAAGESGSSNARDSDPATDGEGEVPEADANEAVDLGDGTAGYSSSDEESDDGLRIVLNDDAGAPPPPPPVGRGEGCVADGEDGEDSCSRVKVSSVNDGGLSTVVGLQCKGLPEKTTLPITGQVDRGRQHVFQRDYNLFLPRNSTIFDIDIEAFQQKPWRQQGVDLTDYFNYNLDEQGWRKYWCNMKQLRMGTRSLANGTSGLDQESYKLKSVQAMPKVANYSGFEGRNGLAKPKGRAIYVEGSAHERVPSADLWRPIQRDSDVVIQVNMTLSPSNQSTSDDSSKLNHKCVTTERMSFDHPGDRCLKGSSFVVDKMVDKEAHDRDFLECSGSKLDRRDSSFARAQSSSPVYSDTLSGESKEDFYFKRSNRRPDSRDFFEDTKLQDEHVKSDSYRHSSKSDRESSESCSLSYTPSPADDRNHKATKLFRMGEAPFTERVKYSGFFVDSKSDHDLKSGRNSRKELKRQSVDGRRHNIFVEKEKSTDNYPSRYDRKYEKRRSSSSSLRTNYYNAARDKFYEKQGYSHLERVALKNDKSYFSNESSHYHSRPLHEISEGEDVEKRFCSAKEWQQHHDHVFQSMLNADISDADDRRMYRERYFQKKRRARHGRVDCEFPHYTDYGLWERQSPEVRGRYRDKGRFGKSNDDHFTHANHLELYPSVNNSQRDCPAAGFPFKSSRNRCIDNKRIFDANMVQNHRDGYHQKNSGNIPRSALCSDTVAETGRFILPVKRKLHVDLGSMNQKGLANLSLLKGRRLMHDQSIVSDRRIYALRLQKFTEEVDTKAICNPGNMRNSNTVSSICIGRDELENADNIRLNDRKIKFERRGNELRRVIQDDQKGCVPVGTDLHSSKQKHVRQNARKKNMDYHHLGSQDLKKSAYQNQENEDGEIEEGELIEQDHRNIISKSMCKLEKVVLKSVIETSSAQLQVNDAMAKNAVCTSGATRECDKHILEVMEKMQKRRERFKEAIAPKKEDDGKKELSAVACSTDHIQNQRPARKRRWGGNN
ncbi:unnamed protein product [Urochloa humidicola]